MKPRKNAIVESAAAFIATAPKKFKPETLVDTVLPGAASELVQPEPFVQKTPVPRGMLHTFTASIIDRVLNKGVKLVDVAPILTASEVEYVTNVLDEVYAWADAQGALCPTNDQVAP